MTNTEQAPLPAELKKAIRSVIWFESPEDAIRNPVRLLCYAMEFTSEPSFSVLRAHFGDEAFSYALRNAVPGIMREPSWEFFHHYFLPYGEGHPTPPMPRRKFLEEVATISTEAATTWARIRSGEEKALSAEQVRRDLGLDR